MGYKGVIYAIKISVLREEWGLVYEVGILAVGEGGLFFKNSSLTAAMVAMSFWEQGNRARLNR